MGFWTRLFGLDSAPKREPFRLSGSGGYKVGIVGESHYQDNLERICGSTTDETAACKCVAHLVSEPTNRDDPNAVRVDIDGRPVGYLSRADAVRYAGALRRMGMSGHTTACDALIVASWDRSHRHFGVKLDLDWPLRRE